MMRIVERLFYAAAIFFVTAGLFSGEARAEKKIGVLIWSDETHYTQARDGMLEQLNKAGYGASKVKFSMENAGGNKAKAADLAQKFAAAKMDMVLVVGTSAAVAVAKDIKDAPVVFSMVFDPVESKIAEAWNSSGNNTTGSSSMVPMAQLLNSLKLLAPVKTLAVLYTSGEKNSESQLKAILAEQNNTRIKVVPVPMTKNEEVAQILSEVIRSSDAIYLTGSSIVGNIATMIVDKATKAKVITVSHLTDYMDKGVLMGVCADPHAVGQLAGDKAVKVLKGAKPASVPIEALKQYDTIVNMKTVKAGGFVIPAAFKSTITKTIE